MNIHIAMPFSDVFGAGTCGKYLLAEFARMGKALFDYVPGDEASRGETAPANAIYSQLTADVDCPLLQFAGPECEQQTRFRGSPNVGYVFTETPSLSGKQIANLSAFDVLVAGSTWNAEVIRQSAGIECAAVPQGVDRYVFCPLPVKRDGDFVIYSGGKWEYRKGQDIVIKAVKVMQQRHKDVRLVASWTNLWSGEDGYDEATRAGLNFSGFPILRQDALCRLMNLTDVGLFPNRCEGGTNLVMMDYLACEKPVVASVTTGQADVLDAEYCRPVTGGDAEALEMSIEGLEFFYRNRDAVKHMGERAGRAMDKWPWSRTARDISQAIGYRESVAA